MEETPLSTKVATNRTSNDSPQENTKYLSGPQQVNGNDNKAGGEQQQQSILEGQKLSSSTTGDNDANRNLAHVPEALKTPTRDIFRLEQESEVVLAMARVQWHEMAETPVLGEVKSCVGGTGAGVDAKLGDDVGPSVGIGVGSSVGNRCSIGCQEWRRY